jgi:hypothetical protein
VARAAAGRGAIPLTVVVDRGGAIRGIWEGYAQGTEAEIEHLTESLLSEHSADSKKAR